MLALLTNVATLLLAAGSIWLAWQAARTCRDSQVLCWLSAFFFTFAVYRNFWAWWWAAGNPSDWAIGWHVTAMLWGECLTMLGLIVALHRERSE